MKSKIALLVAIVAAFSAQQASAAIIGFTASQLTGMTISSPESFNYHVRGSAFMTTLTFETDVPTMSGVAGSNESLGDVGPSGAIYYTLSGTALTDFNTALVYGDELRMVGFNDNQNDDWELGVWYRDSTGTYSDSSTVTALGGSAAYSLAITTGSVEAVGVFVKADGFSDTFHASWSAIPEPGTMAIWGMLGAFGLVGVRRRKV